MVLLERGLGWDIGVPELCYSDTGLPVKHPAWKDLKEELRTEENLLTVEIFSSARQITGPIEAVKRAFKRANFEGIGAAIAVNLATSPLLFTAETLIANAIGLGISMTDPKLAAIVLATAIGGATYKGIQVDAEALRKQGYSATPIGGLLYAATGRPTVSAIADYAFNYAAVELVNPVTGSALVTQNFPFLLENIAAVPLVLAWCIPANSLIASGKVAKGLAPLKHIGETAWQRIKR